MTSLASKLKPNQNMKKIKITISLVTILTIAVSFVFGQTTAKQTVITKFKTYIKPRLEGRQLKTNILEGDLNGDNQTDFVIDYCIQATEADRDAGGGNPLMNLTCTEEGIAVYLKQGTNYTLIVDKSREGFKENFEISIDVIKIEGKAIVCETTSYKDDDPRCCPSLKKTTYLKLNNGKLERSTTPPTTNGQQQTRNWTGTYSYEAEDIIDYTLSIKSNNTCIYEGEGTQTFFKVSCRGQLNGNKYEIFFVKILDGGFGFADWMDKSKPIMTLYYKENKLYTDEGQLNKEVKGGQLLFKKSK